MSAKKKLLDVEHVTASFHIGGLLGGNRLVAVNNVSLSLDDDRPEIFTVAGESGSGKTTLARGAGIESSAPLDPGGRACVNG